MDGNNQRSYRCFIFLFIIFFSTGCGVKSYVNINYKTPLATGEIKGKSIFIDCKDLRSDKTIFRGKTKTESNKFSGLFLLTQPAGKNKNVVLGAFDLPSMFKEAFSRRLKNLGFKVLQNKAGDAPVLEIDIKSFYIKSSGVKWMAQIDYDARLIKNDRVLSTENINGNAEHLKLFSQKDAEKLLSEIFTSTVNRLDIRKMFENAKFL